MSGYKFMHGVDGHFITHNGRTGTGTHDRFVAMETPIPYKQFEVKNLEPPTLSSSTYTATGTYFDVRAGVGGKSISLKCDLMLIHVPGKRIKLDYAWGHAPSPEPDLQLNGSGSANFQHISFDSDDGFNSTQYFDFSPDNYYAYYRVRVSVSLSMLLWWGFWSDAFPWCSLSLSLVDAP